MRVGHNRNHPALFLTVHFLVVSLIIVAAAVAATVVTIVTRTVAVTGAAVVALVVVFSVHYLLRLADQDLPRARLRLGQPVPRAPPLVRRLGARDEHEDLLPRPAVLGHPFRVHVRL